MTRVYLDHNATTPMRDEARELLVETTARLAGNPSSVHASGRAARALLDEARERTAAALGAHEDEIVFVSGGTEANNLALFGGTRLAARGAPLVTTRIEHSSVLEVAARLECERPVERVGVDAAGRPDLAAIVDAARGAALVSVSTANGEVGTIAPVAELAQQLSERYRSARPPLHTDAVQALGRLPLGPVIGAVDLASLSAHKVGGPLGCGVLVRRGNAPLVGQICGGGQESELRAGTENVPAAASGALAIELAVAEQQEYAVRTRSLSLVLWDEVRAALPDACLLGPDIDSHDRLPNTLNVSLPDVDGRVLVTRLDIGGLEVSAGSACASGSLEPSHVLLAMGLDAERARAGLRMSLGRTTTRADIHNAVEILRRILFADRKSR